MNPLTSDWFTVVMFILTCMFTIGVMLMIVDKEFWEVNDQVSHYLPDEQVKFVVMMMFLWPWHWHFVKKYQTKVRREIKRLEYADLNGLLAQAVEVAKAG